MSLQNVLSSDDTSDAERGLVLQKLLPYLLRSILVFNFNTTI